MNTNHPPPPRSLRTEVIWPLVTVVAVLVLGVSLGVYLFVVRAEQVVWFTRHRETANTTSTIVLNYLAQIQQSIRLLGRLPAESDQIAQLTDGLLDDNENVQEIILLDADGQIYASATAGDSAPVLANLFTIPQSNWFIAAGSGQTYIGNLQISTGEEPYVLMAVPLESGGVGAARLRMDVLWNIIRSDLSGATDHAYVIDEEGRIVAHPDPAVVLSYTTITDQPTWFTNSQGGDTSAGSGEVFTQYINYRGEQVLGYATPIPDTRWTVIAEVAVSEATSTQRQALYWLGGGMLVVGLIAYLFITLILDRIVLEPVEALYQGARQVGGGNLAYRITVRGQQNEIGQVAEAFNDMSARLTEREHALAEARDQALEASRFKTRLLANVSHDLRNPLSSIMLSTEMLLDNMFAPLSDPQRNAAERILRNGRSLLDLVNRLLDQAQIEAGQVQFKIEEFLSADQLQDVESAYLTLAENKGLSLITEIDPSLPQHMQGDANRIRQVINNLVANAVKFTTEGEIRVRLFAEDQHWMITVTDTGSGIPPEEQAAIFLPFRRAEDAQIREIDGVGLGLSIVHQLVQLMGGTIHLESAVGKGSTFTVTFPLEAAQETVE